MSGPHDMLDQPLWQRSGHEESEVHAHVCQVCTGDHECSIDFCGKPYITICKACWVKLRKEKNLATLQSVRERGDAA